MFLASIMQCIAGNAGVVKGIYIYIYLFKTATTMEQLVDTIHTYKNR